MLRVQVSLVPGDEQAARPMDQMGEIDYAPGEPKGTPWHPHRGFETVTYMIDGTFQHQDSNGGGGFITDGDTQWMTAGAGLSIC
jgi:redox-sensitive bicupin YhaK (pirin superfamily)